MGKPRTVWLSEDEDKLLRELAKKENRSISNFIKTKCKINLQVMKTPKLLRGQDE